MSGLQINVTPAGRAAIVNAENTGTAPVRIAQIGVTSSGAGLVDGALSGELKRLSTFAGSAVADDTVHVTIRDDGGDVYTLRGFALYLQDGTLFAWYAQAGVILEKSAQAMLLLAADVRFVQIDATSLTFGDTNWINPPATTAVQGVVELADSVESIDGLDGTRAMTPAGAKALLDARFGAGAPSAFVKGLLTLATAALMRTAIGLGNAATRNEGHNNGLDADLLDGQHGTYYLSWANLTGKPATFAPSAHTHVWADIINPPATSTRWPDWLEVTGRPAAFPPSAHTHAAADITSGTLANARVSQSSVTQHQGALSIAWTQLTGAPAVWHSGNFDPATKATLGAYANFDKVDAVGVTASLTHSGGYFTVRPYGGLHDDGGRMEGYYSGSGGRRRFTAYARDPNNAASPLDFDTSGTFYSAGNPVWHSGNFNPETKANVASPGFTGTVTVNGNGVWHAGNFNPASKANLSGANFTGPVTMPTMQATSSDARLKTDISDLRDCLETVRRFRPRRYKMIADGSDDVGWIAQEHRKVLPQAVHEGDDGMLFVRYGKAEPYLAGAIIALADRLDALIERVEAMDRGR
ncbi:tail fiber domain-containing protein [Lysobacter cavernae]|uniref:Tail fiber domain-containing protein n=1 Tax=Lysobacter cavernae TaxID=1685901 RepID=A0ABV7RK28_9GAMM